MAKLSLSRFNKQTRMQAMKFPTTGQSKIQVTTKMRSPI